MESKLHEYLKAGELKFSNNPRFLFYVGWMLEIAFWYFGEATDSLGKSMMLKAHTLAPENVLYAWVCAPYMNIKRSGITIPPEEFEGLGNEIKEYFTNVASKA